MVASAMDYIMSQLSFLLRETPGKGSSLAHLLGEVHTAQCPAFQ